MFSSSNVPDKFELKKFKKMLNVKDQISDFSQLILVNPNEFATIDKAMSKVKDEKDLIR
jgi:hypothetical protein